VEQIKERLNIVELIAEYVPLKKMGTSHKACCPFHNEKTPSFTVSESKQFFHCFGCGKGGDIFTFIQEIEGVEFAEALRILAKKANVELHFTNPREHNERTRLLDCLKSAADFYETTFKQFSQAEHARQYAADRGLQPETQKSFHLGYSPSAWDALLKFLKQKGYSEREIEKAGLSIRSPKTGGWYDRFRNRLMFPIVNVHGNVIGFGGRTLDPDQKEAKYINSPQTDVYNKSATVYGLFTAKKFIQRMDAVVLVEGYMDVIAAHQAKFRNVVAASGTALTIEQVQLLKRFTQNVILSFDGDAAGLKAAWRGMQVAISEGMNIKILRLPTGQDPDDVIRQNPQQFLQLAKEAQPFMDYVFETTLAPLDLTEVHHKKKAVIELLPMIALFPDAVEQTHYIQLLAKKVDVSEDVLMERLDVIRRTVRKYPSVFSTKKIITSQPIKYKQSKQRSELLSEQLFALFSVYPAAWENLSQAQEEHLLVGEELLELYNFLCSYYNQTGIVNPNNIHINQPRLALRWKTLMLIGEELYRGFTTQQLEQEIRTLLESLKRYRIRERLKNVEHQLELAEKNNNTDAIDRLSVEFHVLTESLRNLS